MSDPQPLSEAIWAGGQPPERSPQVEPAGPHRARPVTLAPPLPPPLPAPEAVAVCPLCLREYTRRRKPALLYATLVCSKCRTGLANRRQLAFVLDSVLFFFLYWGFVVAVIALVVESGSPAGPGLASAIGVFAFIFVLPLMFILTFILKDGFSGYSPGKLLLGLRVVDVRTRQPTGFWRSCKRNLTVLVPYAGPIVGAITMMRGQRWGEGWAKTMVIRTKLSHRPPYVLESSLCMSCGYDLTGNVTGICPECGLQKRQANWWTSPSAVPPPLPAPGPRQEPQPVQPDKHAHEQ